jgi:hypothetical protein
MEPRKNLGSITVAVMEPRKKLGSITAAVMEPWKKLGSIIAAVMELPNGWVPSLGKMMIPFPPGLPMLQHLIGHFPGKTPIPPPLAPKAVKSDQTLSGKVELPEKSHKIS